MRDQDVHIVKAEILLVVQGSNKTVTCLPHYDLYWCIEVCNWPWLGKPWTVP